MSYFIEPDELKKEARGARRQPRDIPVPEGENETTSNLTPEVSKLIIRQRQIRSIIEDEIDNGPETG